MHDGGQPPPWSWTAAFLGGSGERKPSESCGGSQLTLPQKQRQSPTSQLQWGLPGVCDVLVTALAVCPKVIIPAFVSCFVFIHSLKLFDKLCSRFSLVLLIVFRRNQGMDIKAVYCHPAYLTFMQSISCKMPGWMKQKLESRLLGEV